MEEIEKEYNKLKQEIIWRYKTTDYKESDKLQVVIHETIDKEVSFISIADVETLCNELGYSKMNEVEQNYLDEFGEFPRFNRELGKQRLLLYWYFEQRCYEDNDIIKLDKF